VGERLGILRLGKRVGLCVGFRMGLRVGIGSGVTDDRATTGA
jgi:hypothetical protein